MESKDSNTSNEANKMCTEIKPMSFDEVAVIIRSGNNEKLKEVFEAGRVNDINALSDTYTPSLLVLACKAGFIDCARVLLDNNADINYTYQTHSVLKSACLSGNVNMLNLLIEHNVTIDDSLIMELFESDEILRNTAIATILVTKIRDVNFRRIDSHDFLHYAACKAGNAIITRMLLERGARYVLGRPGLKFWGLLPDAAGAGHLEVVELLLHWNLATERVSQQRANSALCVAAGCGRIKVVQRLVEYGADALTVALYSAVAGHHVKVAAFLIDKGADFNAVVPNLGCSAWIYACDRGYLDMMRLLLNRGADLNAVDVKGESPLRAATLHPEALMMLLDHGADPNCIISNGSTALLVVASFQRSQSLTVLLEHGADPNLAHAATGETPLMRAALKLRLDNVRLLLERGADVTPVNREGKSVLDMLADKKYSRVVKDREKYSEMRELCTQYMDSNKPGATHILK